MIPSAARRALAVLLLNALAIPSLFAQTPAATPTSRFNLTDRLPFDPAVATGTLPNGLEYFIRKNGKPEKRVLLRLAVQAGSVDEADDQQGLAHFLEHMAFNGSRHFKPGELVATFEKTGSRLGPHVNAYTGFDETVYMFELPTDSAEIVKKGMQALADFAGGMTLDPKEIDKERGVVIEEWRGGLGASSRIRDQQIPVLFYKSKYAERLPIGKPEVLKSFTPETLRAFYTKWYRTDRMAVVVVGDIDPARMEALIRTELGSLPKPATAAPERSYSTPLHQELLVKVATDPEVPQSSVSLMRKRARPGRERVGDYRRSLVHSLVFQMINERFDELSRKPDAQFLGAGAYSEPLSPTVTAFTLGAGVEDGTLAAGLSALEIEANRIRRHGFGAAELERARKWMLAFYERAFTERDKTESAGLADEYVRHFLEQEPVPGIAFEYELAKSFVPAITAADVDEAARTLFSDDSRVVIGVSPQKAGLTVPTDANLREALMKAETVAVTPWNDATSGRALMERVPEPAAITGRRTIPELGVTVVRFANGVEGWFKPTTFKNEEVLFSLVASGGASLAPPDLYPEASLAPAQIELSGVGGHTAVDLQKLLAGTIASASPYVSTSTHGVSGSSTPANLEPALQLLHLSITAPGNDDEAFAFIRKQLDATYANRDRNPALLFGEKVAQVNTNGHYTSRPITPERIAKLDRGAMVSFYRDRFANAADFTFFMVGAFKLDEALPLAARYVGSLPSKGAATSTYKDIGLTFPATVRREVVEKGREPRAQTVVSFFADPAPDPQEQTRVDAAAEVLEIALRDILREELGETYNVSVGLDQPLPQRGAGRIAVSFGGAPENVDRMVDRLLQEVKRLQAEGPSADLTSRAKESARRQHEEALRENGFWLGSLQSAKLIGRDPLLVLQREQRIAGVTPPVLEEMFKKYFPLDRYTVVTLRPQKE
jgi:zinc protease